MIILSGDKCNINKNLPSTAFRLSQSQVRLLGIVVASIVQRVAIIYARPAVPSVLAASEPLRMSTNCFIALVALERCYHGRSVYQFPLTTSVKVQCITYRAVCVMLTCTTR